VDKFHILIPATAADKAEEEFLPKRNFFRSGAAKDDGFRYTGTSEERP
jgi:hypothetical protein